MGTLVETALPHAGFMPNILPSEHCLDKSLANEKRRRKKREGHGAGVAEDRGRMADYEQGFSHTLLQCIFS